MSFVKGGYFVTSACRGDDYGEPIEDIFIYAVERRHQHFVDVIRASKFWPGEMVTHTTEMRIEEAREHWANFVVDGSWQILPEKMWPQWVATNVDSHSRGLWVATKLQAAGRS
tara:strand:+ start:2612 stop:2950 length:339 start_codon:yes stop_codon:yes gene_type:complete